MRQLGYILVIALFSGALIGSCANIMSPQGGPRDTLPPRIMGAEPMFNTTNFKAKKIYIAFDEFVQIKDQQKEFFVSPMMKKQPVMYIKGRGIQIEIKDDSLAENTTYSLNFGNSIRDNNEGNPLNGFRYVFSTGDEIDSMILSAYTADAYRGDSVSRTLLYFFPAELDSIPEYDSLMFKQKPVSISRAENNGIVIAKNLKPINYRIYAMLDGNSNFTYEPGTDKIGFLDGSFNPLDLPDFSAWYDTTRMYMTAEPQLYFRMFTDKQFKRQFLSKFQRPEQHKITLMFGAATPHIDSIRFGGILPENVITEYVTKGRDTINYWLNMASELLPDTIWGYITYEKHDSLNVLYAETDTLALSWKFTETKAEQNAREEREEMEKDRREDAEKEGIEYVPTPIPTKFKFSGGAQSEVIPDIPITFTFDKPLSQVDTTMISLIRLGEEDRRFRVRYSFEQDTAKVRNWLLSANWQTGQKYEFVIAQGALQDVASERNDTIKQSFTIADPEKYGTLAVDITGKTDTSTYILQLLNPAGNQIIAEKRGVKTSKVVFTYLKEGDMILKVIEDENGNGEWDGGNLVQRIQPERVEIYTTDNGSETFSMKTWEVEMAVDMAKLFAPINIDNIRHKLEVQEQQRAKRLAEERAKKTADKAQQNRPQNSNQGFGGTTGIGNTGSRGFGR